MTHQTSQIQVDGLWRNLLVIISEVSINWGEKKEVSISIGAEQDNTTIVYYTEGIYKYFSKDGEHVYWFLYNERQLLMNNESEELTDLRLANDILIGVQV